MPSPKSHYLPTLYGLTLISLLSGLISFTALILFPLPCTPTLSKLQGLLTIPTLLLLTNPLLALTILAFLHPLHAHPLVFGYRRRLTQIGIALLNLFLLTAFIHLAVAIQVLFAGPAAVGYVGIGLFSVATAGAVILGLTAQCPSYGEGGKEIDGKGRDKHPLTPALYRIETKSEEMDNKAVPDLGWAKICFVAIIYVLEFGGFLALLGIGGNAALHGVVPASCGLDETGAAGTGVDVGAQWTKTNPLPIDVVNGEVFSVVVTITETQIRETSTCRRGDGRGSSSVQGSLSSGQLTWTTGADGVVTVVDWTSVTTFVDVTVSA